MPTVNSIVHFAKSSAGLTTPAIFSKSRVGPKESSFKWVDGESAILFHKQVGKFREDN